MPWANMTVENQRQEFVTMAQGSGIHMVELCRRFDVSPKTGYKWVARYRGEGPQALSDRSRRPHHTPRRTAAAPEAAVCELRREHSSWGARKIRRRLQDLKTLKVPACSTITRILHRHGLMESSPGTQRSPWQRFEYPTPNALWQMDFKGPIKSLSGRIHPLTVLDDHSRYSIVLQCLSNETEPGVRMALTDAFRKYGLPDRMLMDNGSPWGSGPWSEPTALSAWMMRLGIKPLHSRPYHPQTCGKDERFHRTLKLELLSQAQWRDVPHLQDRANSWRHIYNHERPHEALHGATPASCYRPSLRAYPEVLPTIEYGREMAVRLVGPNGRVLFHGKTYSVGKAFRGYPLGLRPTEIDGQYDVFFQQFQVGLIDIRKT
jgi:transposase InsO family protein